MDNLVYPKIGKDSYTKEIEQAILSLEVMPSMRALMTAGPALARDNTAGYNCSYLPVDDLKSFDEAMFILLCGTGVGFSVERQFISKLPEVPQLFESDTVIVVKDSKEGWAKAFRQVIALLYSGEIPQWDVSKVRPAGAKLKTFGGRASGPAPLVDLFNFTIRTFKEAQGRKLSSLECHDIMCKIGEVVVVGGVRRSAMISLSNLSDDRMRHAKSGAWWENNPQRALANNSVSYTEKPDSLSFMREWMALVESGSGERGIFNRQASKVQAAKNGRRDADYDFGTNPCSEIILRPNQFCNLTECVVRATDSIEYLEK
jgi:ribonucleoside-diphosphate reductase alpha chain